jgi:hypothetical protein
MATSKDVEGRGSEVLIKRLTDSGYPAAFGKTLVGALGDAKPLELRGRAGGGATVTFMTFDVDDDWCGTTTKALLKLRRKFPFPIVIDWFPYGIINPDVLIGRLRVGGPEL